MQLEPQSQFVIARKLDDHTDSNTYYVRAVIRDALSDTILDTINLNDKTGQRFTKQWQVAADTSGLGKYITIETSVYTDSGYTTKSERYGDKITTYLVRRFKSSTGGGADGMITPRQLKKALMAEIGAIKFPEQRAVDLSSLDKGVKDLIKINSEDKFAGVINDIGNATKKIGELNNMEKVEKMIVAKFKVVEEKLIENEKERARNFEKQINGIMQEMFNAFKLMNKQIENKIFSIDSVQFKVQGSDLKNDNVKITKKKNLARSII